MELKQAEQIFNRALKFSLSRKKFLFVFPILVLCGLLVVFCRALAVGASDWIILSLTFLPVFLSFGVLLTAGVFLIKVYCKEVSGESVGYISIIRNSWQLMIGVSYLSIPMILTYLLLWTTLGIFYLLKEIPAIGEAASVLLSFGPFLLVLGSLILCCVHFFLLFFVTPHVALKSSPRLELAGDAFNRVRQNIFSNLYLFLLASVPMLLIVGLLTLAAMMTGSTFLHSTEALGIALEWFFIMLPFCAILTPVVTFFFNFAAESYVYIERQTV